ncbi:hypothetical protein LWI29_032050 [Acer saccharum]|uniref:PPM-type phosphatase domain-containing protein n=1 Tax=Acer saccharum TaxID=4024 RepID=A0AA39W4P1_ACESA|nr:hypothetical protein LWI29_032050 [Acer saccharum]
MSQTEVSMMKPPLVLLATLIGRELRGEKVEIRDLSSLEISLVSSYSHPDEWLQALPRALIAGFVKTDIEFQQKGETSETTVTFVVIDGWTVTVASVGDSRCILDTHGGVVSLLTVDYRLEENVEERE